MKKIAVLFADGTEELEGLTPVDLLRRAGATCDIISVDKEFLTGSHNIVIKSDKNINEISFCDYDAVIVPGGMPGAVNISRCDKAVEFIRKLRNDKKLVASICASPAVVLAQNNLLNDNKATCYPAPQFVELMGENYEQKEVQVSNTLITANGPKSAFSFSLEIIKYLGLDIKF